MNHGATVDFVAYFIVTYHLNSGTGTTPTESNKPAGATFTAAATTGISPPGGQQFKEWNTANDGSGTSYAPGATVAMPAAALDLYAIWEPVPTYPVTVTSEGTGASGSGYYAAGETVTVVAGAVAGRYFSGWTVAAGTGVIFADAASATTTFVMPPGAVALTAVFASYPPPVIQRPITVAPTVNGRIASDRLYARTGETVTLTLTPDAGYVWDAITVHQTGNETVTVPLTESADSNVRTFRMPPYAVTVTATFRRDDVAVEDLNTPKALKAFTRDGILYVSGLQPGATWYVYNVPGSLVYQGVANGDRETWHTTSLPQRGVYIVISADCMIKVVN
jgi:hypothetical protein